MKKLLIFIIFLLFLLASCSDIPVNNSYEMSFNVTEHIEETTGEVIAELTEESTECDVSSDIITADAETEPIFVESATTALYEETENQSITVDAEDFKGFVYLTFDDGPGKRTERVLEILDEYDVPATFFMVGQYMSNHESKVKSVYEAGHIIGCHSMSHDYRGIYKDAESITNDIEEWENIFYGIFGREPESFVYRFPGGSTCSAIEKGQFEELHEAVLSLGYRSFDWTCANNDLYRVNMKEDEELTDFLKRSLEESLKRCGQPKIVLVHETVAETVEILPWIIEYIRGEGYEFALLTDYDGEYIFAY